MAVEKKRVFIGGLFHGVTEQQVCERFNKFGTVDSVSVRVKTDETGQPVKTFAYVDITASEKSLRQCMQVYNKSKWKGGVLQLQFAKENFLDRLKKEQIEAKEEKCVQKPTLGTEAAPVAVMTIPKRATPGTVVGEEKTWVVGKYGRVLPIVNIRRKDKKKVILFDPSKCCHQLKKLDTTAKGDEVEKPVEHLTWQLDDDNSMMTKLRTGQVASKKVVKKKKVTCKASPPALVTDRSPKRPKEVVDDNQFEIVKSHSVCGAHQQDDDEAYNSADTEEMITLMKSSSTKTRTNNSSCSEKVDTERTRKLAPDSSAGQLKTKTCVDVLKRADISAISPIGVCVNGSVEKPQSLSTQGQLKMFKPLRRASLMTSTPKDINAKRVCHSDTDSDSSLERFPPKKKQKLKPPKEATRRDESDSSPDTDDVISDLRRKVATPRNAWTTVSLERSLYITADDDLRPDSQRESSSHYEDDDEDVFDLIESGRIDQLYKTATNSVFLKGVSDISPEQEPQVGDHSTSKATVEALETSVTEDDANMKDKTNLSSSKKLKRKKNKENKALPESNSSVTMSGGKGKTKEKTTFAQKFDKRKLSNAQRVTSVNERLKEAKSQRFLIKKALSDVDKTSSVKKIIFDSSDEEDARVGTPRATSISEEGQGDGTGDSNSDSSSSEDDTQKQDDSTKKKTGLLFDSDSGSSESEAEDQRMFELRPEFEGRGGSKLMKLQARFRNDQRFKLDKRFLESDSDAESQEEATHRGDDLDKGDDERAKSLAILKSVVGEKAVEHINQRSKKTATFKDVATLHYDPSREDHRHFELEKPRTKEDEESEEEVVEKKSKKKKKKEGEATPSEQAAPPPEKLPGKFFEVSGSLIDLLKPAEKKPFSLLSMFGSADSDHTDMKQKLNDDAVAEKLPVGHMQWQPQFGSDDSEEETEGASPSVREDSKGGGPVESLSSGQEQKTFFFIDNDCRITDGIKSFCRPEDWEAIREKWLEKRPDLVEDYRMKRKRAMRKGQSQRGKFGKTQRGGRR